MWNKLCTLIWKNYKIFYRNRLLFSIQIISPILTCLILLFIRKRVLPIDFGSKNYTDPSPVSIFSDLLDPYDVDDGDSTGTNSTPPEISLHHRYSFDDEAHPRWLRLPDDQSSVLFVLPPCRRSSRKWTDGQTDNSTTSELIELLRQTSSRLLDNFIPRIFLDQETAVKTYDGECKVNERQWWEQDNCHIKAIVTVDKSYCDQPGGNGTLAGYTMATRHQSVHKTDKLARELNIVPNEKQDYFVQCLVILMEFSLNELKERQGSINKMNNIAIPVAYPIIYDEYDFIPVIIMPFFFISFTLCICLYSTQLSWSLTNAKSSKMQTYLNIMGVSTDIQVIADFLTYISLILMYLVLITYSAVHPIYTVEKYGYLAAIPYLDLQVMIYFAISSSLASLAFAYLVSSVTDNASIASVFTVIVLMSNDIRREIYVGKDIQMFSIVDFGYTSAQIIVYLEEFVKCQRHVTTDTYDHVSSPHSVYTIKTLMLVLLVDAVAYVSIARYVNSLKGRGHMKIFNIFKNIYKEFLTLINTKKNYGRLLIEQDQETLSSLDYGDDEIPARLTSRNVTKMYGKVKIMHSVDLDLYPGEIIAVLGHNGAGKTTLVNILSGFTNQTTGTLKYEGVELNGGQSCGTARRGFGVCTQFDILYEDLTIDEHILFVNSLCGYTCDHAEINDLIYCMHLESKRGTASKVLSGGERRKLSIILALISGSKVIVLDEPTSSLDAECCQILSSMLSLMRRKSKTIVVSTHSVQEAMMLADTVLVIEEGHVVFKGTPQQCNTRYGSSYILKVSKDLKCNIYNVLKLMKPYFSSLSIINNDVQDAYVLIYGDMSLIRSKMSDFLGDLERQKESLKVNNFTLEICNLQDIYKPSTLYKYSGMGHDLKFGNYNPCNKYVSSFMNRRLILIKSFALVYKRIRHLLDTNAWIYLILIPILLFFSIAVDTEVVPETHLNLDIGMEFFSEKTSVLLFGTTEYLDVMSRYMDTMHITYTKITALNHGHYVTSLKEYGRNNTYDFLYKHACSIYMNDSMLTYFHNERVLFAEVHTAKLVAMMVMNSSLGRKSTVKTIHEHSRIVQQEMDTITRETKKMDIVFTQMVQMYTIFITLFILYYSYEYTDRSRHYQILKGISIVTYFFVNYLIDLLVIAFLNFTFLMILTAYDVVAVEVSFWLIFSVFQLHACCTLVHLHVFVYLRQPAGKTYIAVLAFYSLTVSISVVVVAYLTMFQDYIGNGLVKLQFLIPVNVVNEITEKILKPYTKSSIECKITCPGESPSCRSKTPGCDSSINYSASNENPGILYFAVMDVVVVCMVVAVIACLEMFSYPVKKFLTGLITMNPAKHITLNLGDNNTSSDEKSEENVLEVKSLTKSYVMGKYALSNINLALKKGECLGVIGENGSGKSTLFSILTNSQYSNIGRVIFHTPQSLGYCPQQNCAVPYLSVGDNLRFYQSLSDNPKYCSGDLEERWRDTEQLLMDLNLLKYYKIQACKLSGGNLRKLSLAIALISSPNLLILDEPTTGLDPESSQQVWRRLRMAKNDYTTIVVSSHKIQTSGDSCDRLAVLSQGRLPCLGALRNFRSQYCTRLQVHVVTSKPEEVVERCTEIWGTGSVRKSASFKNKISIQVDKNTVSWSRVFKLLETMSTSETYGISDYSVNQISLDEVFASQSQYIGDRGI